MNDEEKLGCIARLFGGVNKLGEVIGLDGSGISRRINGKTKISRRDWIALDAAVEKRIQELQSAIYGE